MNNKINPFKYGKVVGKPYFTGREDEIKMITSTLKSGNNVILVGPRRFGKTSLIKEVIKEIDSPNTVFLDFYSITSQRDFINQYTDKILNTQKLPVQKIVKKIKDTLKHITPSVSFDNLGNPTWSLNYNGNTNSDQILHEVLDLPQKLSENKHYYIVFDEFQEINKLNGDNFEKQLRAVIQNHINVSYIFLGSKSHLLMEMFNSNSRALYNAAKLISLRKIDRKTFTDFIVSRFVITGIGINQEIAELIVSKAHNIPYYVQYLAAQVWQLVRISNLPVSSDIVADAVDRILDNQGDYYFMILESLSLYQRAVLKAMSTGQENIFSQDYHQYHNLSSISSTQRAIKSLIDKSVLEKEDDKYSFADPFFFHWMQLRGFA